MSIVDQYSNPVTSTRKLVHASDQSRLRGPQFIVDCKPIEELINDRDRDVIISLSQRLYFNLGPMKSVVDQKRTYSVGNAWLPVYNGSDTDNGKVVKSKMLESFFVSLDVRGGQWDWWENLKSVSSEIDIRGDHFTLLTLDETGTQPRIQNIPSYLVKTKGKTNKGKVTGGKYNNKEITHGIIYSDVGKPLAYRVSTGNKADDFTDISAESIHHSYDPSLSDGKRGLPVATHALEDLKHVLQSTEYERTRQLIMSSIGLFIENDTGGPNVNDPRNALLTGATPSNGAVTVNEISPSIWYSRAGDNEKITQLKHEAGGDTFESFHDRMIRSFVAGANWSYSLTWKPTGQGTAERGEIMQARKAVQERQKRLERWAKRVLTYAYSIYQQNGDIPELENPIAWEFTKPPRISVDDGREDKMLNDGFRIGKYNMTDLLEAEGRTFDDHLTTRINESIKRKQVIEKAYEDTGYIIDERELVMFTPNDQDTTQQSSKASLASGNKDGENSSGVDEYGEPIEADDPDSFETLKSKFDAYGVAVRAGAITPAVEDEELFRSEGGLPKMSKAVKKAWAQDGFFRRPITLVAPESKSNNQD